MSDTTLINDVSINGQTNTSESLSTTLQNNTVNAIGVDASSRTIWVNGQPYGNAYVNVNDDNTVDAPIGAEIFNDFEHNVAAGEYSHASGLNTIASGEAEHVVGKYNDTSEVHQFSVGIGTADNDRKNAFEVDVDGTSHFTGDIFIDGLGDADSGNNNALLENSIIVAGSGEGSGVMKGAGNSATGKNALAIGTSNNAISENSVALGNNNFAGLTGWYYSSINKINDTTIDVYLSDSQRGFPIYPTWGGTTITSNLNPYEILGNGTIVSLINDVKYDNKFKIIEGQAGRIRLQTIDGNVPFDQIITELVLDPEDYSIYCLSKPDKGVVDVSLSNFAEGRSTYALGACSHAEGYNTTASGKYSHTEGRDTEALYIAHAEGSKTKALGNASHAEGTSTKALNSNSHAEGYETEVKGYAGHAEGIGTKVLSDYGHSEGERTEVSINSASAHAEGIRTKASNIGAHAEGRNTIASGLYSHAEGYNDDNNTDYGAFGPISHVEGYATVTTINANSGHAEGRFTTVSNLGSHAEGISTTASGEAAHTEGKYTSASGEASHAEGKGESEANPNLASGKYSHVEGEKTKATNTAAHAEGMITEASGMASHTEGRGTSASGEYTHAEGFGTAASIKAAHAEGISTTASGEAAHAEGSNNVAIGNYSHAEGQHTRAHADYSHVEGLGVSGENVDNYGAFGPISHIEGYGNTTATTANSGHAEGRLNTVSGMGAHAEGISNIASGEASHSEGKNTKASGIGSHAEGGSVGTATIAFGNYSHAEGEESYAGGQAAHAEGHKTKAFSLYTHSEGDETTSSGEASHAEGYFTKAEGIASHAEGMITTSSGKASHTEGEKTKATNIAAHAEGMITTSSGKASHTEGRETQALADYAHSEGYLSSVVAGATGGHAEGIYNIVNNYAEHAEGKYNKSNNNTIHSVGIGESNDNRKNAHEILSTGENYIYNLGGYDGTNPTDSKDLATILSTVDTSDSNTFIVENNLDVENNANIRGTLGIIGDTTFEQNVNINGDIFISGLGLDDFNGSIKENMLLVRGYGENSIMQYTSDDSTTTSANGKYSAAIGYNCIADGDYSHAEGYDSWTIGAYSHAEGYHGQTGLVTINEDGTETIQAGNYAHVEGYNCISVGNYSHAEGYQCQAVGNHAHAEGIECVARAEGTHAGGWHSIARGIRSFAHGLYVDTNNFEETGFGSYNVSVKKTNGNTTADATHFSVGIGTAGTSENPGLNRKNAFEIKQNGDTYISSNKIDIKTNGSNRLNVNIAEYTGGTIKIGNTKDKSTPSAVNVYGGITIYSKESTPDALTINFPSGNTFKFNDANLQFKNNSAGTTPFTQNVITTQKPISSGVYTTLESNTIYIGSTSSTFNLTVNVPGNETLVNNCMVIIVFGDSKNAKLQSTINGGTVIYPNGYSLEQYVNELKSSGNNILELSFITYKLSSSKYISISANMTKR